MKLCFFTILLIFTTILISGCSGNNTNGDKTITKNKEITSMFNIQRIWVSTTKHLIVEIVPKNKVKPNISYRVKLYENDNFRESSMVSWNQPELNVHTMKAVSFRATRQESNAYCLERDLSNIFSVKIYEIPKDGE